VAAYTASDKRPARKRVWPRETNHHHGATRQLTQCSLIMICCHHPPKFFRQNVWMGGSTKVFDRQSFVLYGTWEVSRESSSIPATVKYGDDSASDDFSKATLFNNYFYSVFSSSNFVLPDNITHINTSVQKHISVNITEEEVLEVLNSLNVEKATGVDKIGPRIFKKCALCLQKPLHHLFWISLNKHILLSE